jgi:hypothetical protein
MASDPGLSVPLLTIEVSGGRTYSPEDEMPGAPTRPADLVRWAVRTRRVSAARGQWYLEQAANGADVSVLARLAPAPAALGEVPPDEGDDYGREYEALFAPGAAERRARDIEAQAVAAASLTDEQVYEALYGQAG